MLKPYKLKMFMHDNSEPPSEGTRYPLPVILHSSLGPPPSPEDPGQLPLRSLYLFARGPYKDVGSSLERFAGLRCRVLPQDGRTA